MWRYLRKQGLSSSLLAIPGVKRRVVIVGAGFAGLQVALQLAQEPVEVILIDRNNHHVFQPFLCQVATAGLTPADVAAPIRHIVGRQKNVRFLMDEVIGVDREQQRVLLPMGRSIDYETLIIATGSRCDYAGHDEWSMHASGLKSILDATAIRRKILMAFEAAEIEDDPERVRELLTFVLVGAGPTGVEMAALLSDMTHSILKDNFRCQNSAMARILLVEARSRILSAFPASMATRAHTRLVKAGVEVRVNARVDHVDQQGVIIAGERLRAATVIWLAGVRAEDAGLWFNVPTDEHGRVYVSADLSLPGADNVFVLGDVACVMQDGKPLPAIATVAIQEGRYVADLLVRRAAGERVSEPFTYVHKGNLATVGRSFALADLGVLRLTGRAGWLFWLVAHIFSLVSFRSRVVLLSRWTWAYLTYQRGARLIPNATSSSSPQELLPR